MLWLVVVNWADQNTCVLLIFFCSSSTTLNTTQQLQMDLKILSPVPTTKVKNDRMDVDQEAAHLVNPGEVVTTDQQFMR